MTRAELLTKWEQGWTVVLGALAELADADLERTVTIRGQGLKVHDALHRSLAHTSYHVGQIVYVAKAFRGNDWTSAEYSASVNPTRSTRTLRPSGRR